MKKHRCLLIDGDMVAYRNAAALEEGSKIDWGDGVVSRVDRSDLGFRRMDGFIARMKRQLKADKALICLSDRECFRRTLAPSYKENREGKVRPDALAAFKEYLETAYDAISIPQLEADDVMGILATDPFKSYEQVIVCNDKDLRQIPGLHFNPFKDKEVETITLEQADRFFFYQTLVGDEIDGYHGCRGIGPVTANRILDRAKAKWREKDVHHCELVVHWWDALIEAFKSKKFTEADALMNARMAKILRCEDWSPDTGVKLWSPP